MRTSVRCAAFALVIPFLLGSCCATPHEEAGLGDPPDDPAVATAGWESHPGGEWVGPGTHALPRTYTATSAGQEALGPNERRAELDSLRSANKRLMSQVTSLLNEVQAMKAGSDPVAVAMPAAPVEMVQVPAPVRPALTVETVKQSLGGSAAADLFVGQGADGAVFLRVPGNISFDSGKADLRAGAQSRLRSAIAALLGRFPNLRVRVEGHTDADPIKRSKWANNQVLSEARAGAVASYLVNQTPLSSDRVTSVGCGADRPVAANDTPQGKALNRRVEILLMP